MLEPTGSNQSQESKLFKEAEALTPQFSSNEEAINFYLKKLESYSSKYKKTIEELVLWAEEETEFKEDLSSIQMLSRKIKVLRQL